MLLLALPSTRFQELLRVPFQGLTCEWKYAFIIWHICKEHETVLFPETSSLFSILWISNSSGRFQNCSSPTEEEFSKLPEPGGMWRIFPSGHDLTCQWSPWNLVCQPGSGQDTGWNTRSQNRFHRARVCVLRRPNKGTSNFPDCAVLWCQNFSHSFFQMATSQPLKDNLLGTSWKTLLMYTFYTIEYKTSSEN